MDNAVMESTGAYMDSERHSQRTIEDLKERRRRAAEQVRYLLHELEAAEVEFEEATRELQKALDRDPEAAA